MKTGPAFRAAKAKIQEARDTGSSTLDLSCHPQEPPATRLTDLPDGLQDLRDLSTLDLSHQGLSEIPEQLRHLKRLKRLSLRGNCLTGLPDWLPELNELELLDLSENSLSVIPGWLGQFPRLQVLDLRGNLLDSLPESPGPLARLERLDLSHNRFVTLPAWLGEMPGLQHLRLEGNRLTELPQFRQLKYLGLDGNPFNGVPRGLEPCSGLRHLSLQRCDVEELPEWMGGLRELRSLDLADNRLVDLDRSLADLHQIVSLNLDGNHLSPELKASFNEGLPALKAYLRSMAGGVTPLNEAKLILVGEGEAGKSSLLAALRGDPWRERDSTHGIEVHSFKVLAPDSGKEITLNGWDFGGQAVYRPTHQLFFTAPAIYLVVWKPREGPQMGQVREWIRLIITRQPEARILVVATHGGPGGRLPDIDRQEIWEEFGRERVTDFFWVDSKSRTRDGRTEDPGIAGLKNAIASVAADLPEVDGMVPSHWLALRRELRTCGKAYLHSAEVSQLCRQHGIAGDDAEVLLRIFERIGDLIHYEHDPLLKDIVIIRPDWLANAIGLVLADRETREMGHGLISQQRLAELWGDPERGPDMRFPPELHPMLLRLMERFDLCYRIPGSAPGEDAPWLVAQLVPDLRPQTGLGEVWPAQPAKGDSEETQVCRITEADNHQSANAEGLFYQLIVRLHRFSLGRVNFQESVHWQRGLIVEDNTGARALLEHTGNDVRVTVRSPWPTRFLSALTYEVHWLVQNFWSGLRCDVTVPCLTMAADGRKCRGLLEVSKLLKSKSRGRAEHPCPVCNEWLPIDRLLGTSTQENANPLPELMGNLKEVRRQLDGIRAEVRRGMNRNLATLKSIDATGRMSVEKVEAAYTGMMQAMVDEAKDGPRLFSFEPVERGFLDRPAWVSTQFRITLWCEHCRVPLCHIPGSEGKGVYSIEVPREWLRQSAPFLKVLSTTLGLILPVAHSTSKLVLLESDYKALEDQLDLARSTADSLLKGGGMSSSDDLEPVPAGSFRASGDVMRQLHVWIRKQDPSFGGLVRVQNRRHEFLWVHPDFAAEY